VKSIKGTKRRGGGPGDLPRVDEYKDREFTISYGDNLDSGWKIDVRAFGHPVIRTDLEIPRILMSKPTIGGLGVYVSFEELEKYNNWFKIKPHSLESSAPPSLGSSAKP
jgi:hypothetical protein